LIGSLRGTLLDRGDAEVTVEAGGVGYRVLVSPTTAISLGEVHQEVFCWVHHHQREDAVTLYGFATKDERSSFEALIGAHGVGPALALAILSVHSPVALARVVAEDDLGALCLVPGVGKKTAQRLLIDLKSRLSIPDPGDGPVAGAPTTASGPASARADVRDALAGLGYTDGEVREVMADLPDDGDAGALLRDALQRLGAARR
jgi:Holliday junction DNA helicase RuvA